MDDELPPLSPYRARKALEAYQETVEMDNQLKIWEMILEYLASWDFIFVILTVFVGVAVIKSIKVIDRYINETTKPRSDDDGTED